MAGREGRKWVGKERGGYEERRVGEGGGTGWENG